MIVFTDSLSVVSQFLGSLYYIYTCSSNIHFSSSAVFHGALLLRISLSFPFSPAPVYVAMSLSYHCSFELNVFIINPACCLVLYYY